MVNSVKSRPNHYEVLGLSATASREEINRAFVKEMGMFGARPVAAAAQIGAAFEILRDPAKRRNYDRELGLMPEPGRRTIAGQNRGAGFIGWGSSAAVDRVTFENLPHRNSEALPQRPSEPSPQEKLASIVASLRQLSESQAPPATDDVTPRPESRRSEEKLLSARLDPRVEELLAVRIPEEESAYGAEHRFAEWRRPALAVSAVVLVAGLFGALGGFSLRDAEQKQLAAAVTTPLPAARPVQDIAAVTAATLVDDAASGRNEMPVRAEHAVARGRRAIRPELPAAPDGQATDENQSLARTPADGQADVASSDPLAPASQAVEALPASMPIPNKVIASTIERIGYACGEVSSTAIVDGAAPGTFRVSCSSGHAYQATPVHGRYRFRRLGRQ